MNETRSVEKSFHDADSPIRLLSLDGGGIRGLSSLIILQHLMKQVDHENPPKPCDYFDLIGGTSTGGLIAIMLGRLRMSINECIEKYMKISVDIFQNKRSSVNVIGRMQDMWKAEGKFDSDEMIRQFKDVARHRLGNQDALLKEENQSDSCKVFVCTLAKTNNTPVKLRSYVTADSVDTIDGCKIWEAARATSAASRYFDPIKIGSQTFVDGATGCNNPVESVWQEAEAIWTRQVLNTRIQSFVSIGTGKLDSRDFGDDMTQIMKALVRIATETEATASRFYDRHFDLGLEGRYFRFNVTQGLSTVKLYEVDKRDVIEAATQAYLEDTRTKQEVKLFGKVEVLHGDMEICTASQRDSFLEWLPRLPSRKSHHNAVLKRSNPDTGKWFLENEFLQWTRKRSSFTWLHGKAGSGKTVLCSSVIQDLKKHEMGPVVPFYFSFERPEEIDAYQIICSLATKALKNLICSHSGQREMFLVPRKFRQFYQNCYPSNEPDFEDLKQMLWDLLRRLDNIYIVLDGLDESTVQIQKRVLSILGEISQQSGGSSHILLSSRHETSMEVLMSKSPIQVDRVPMRAQAVNEDIQRHLKSLINNEQHESYGWWSDRLKLEVIDHLTERSDGVFRWADLQIQRLLEEDREKDVRRALKVLPSTLQKTYERMLRTIQQTNSVNEALMILSWLAYARRPLTLSEIAELAAFEIEDLKTPPDSSKFVVTFDPNDRFPDFTRVRRLVSGLVSLDDEEGNQTGSVVRFAHFSVLEYLESQEVLPRIFHLHNSSCHWLILRSCFAYLAHYNSDFGGADGEKPYPLLVYAYEHWLQHGKSVGLFPPSKEESVSSKSIAREIESSMVAFARKVLDLPTSTDPVASAAETQDMSSAATREEDDCGTEVAFATLAQFSNDRYGQPFLESEDALFGPVSFGDWRLVRFFLDAGYKDPFLNSSRGSIFHIAARGRYSRSGREPGFDARRDHARVVRQLVEAGFQNNGEDRFGLSPLHVASQLGRVDVIEALLNDAGMDINLPSRAKQTALGIAADAGHASVVRFILNRTGVVLDSKDANANTPLGLACTKGHTDIVELFLAATDLDTNATNGGSKRSALAIASFLGHDAIVELLLLDPRVEVNAKDTQGMTPLLLAVFHGHEKVVRLILAQDKSAAGFCDMEGTSALSFAESGGHYAIFNMLQLSCNSNINIATDSEWISTSATTEFHVEPISS